jgi:hypothetical protein
MIGRYSFGWNRGLRNADRQPRTSAVLRCVDDDSVTT